MNQIEAAFVGRAVSVAPLKTSAAGKSWAAFKVAVGQDDAVQWVRVVCFGDLAEQVAPQIEKSDRVYVEGTLRLDNWINAEGQPRSGLSVAAWKVERLGQIGRNKPPKAKVADHQRPLDPPPRGAGGFSLRRETDRSVGLDDAIPF